MASNTKTQREPIVTTDTEEVVTETPVNVEPPKKSSRLVNIKEFIHGQTMRLEEIAAFRVFVENTRYMSTEEWNARLTEFRNRKVK
jgi:hypothetical protein